MPSAPHITVTALYRHPVKSFTPERREQLSLTADGRVQGDHVLAFRLADVAPPDDLEWRRKHNYIALATTPGTSPVFTATWTTTRCWTRFHDGRENAFSLKKILS